MKENIDICVNSLCKYIDIFEGFNKNEFRQLLHLTKKESHFFFKETLYKQFDGAAKESLVGPYLLNAFLAFYTKQWLKEHPIEFMPFYY